MTRYRQRPERVYPGRKTQTLGRREGRMNIVGQRLKEARLARSPQWSQEDLSQALIQHADVDLSPATLGKIERGIRSAYDFEVAAFIRVLSLDPAWLLGLTEAPVDPA